MFHVTADELIAHVNALRCRTLCTLARNRPFTVTPRDNDSFVITPARGKSGGGGKSHLSTRPYIAAFCAEFSRENSWEQRHYYNLTPQTPNQSYLLALTRDYLASQGLI